MSFADEISSTFESVSPAVNFEAIAVVRYPYPSFTGNQTSRETKYAVRKTSTVRAASLLNSRLCMGIRIPQIYEKDPEGHCNHNTLGYVYVNILEKAGEVDACVGKAGDAKYVDHL